MSKLDNCTDISNIKNRNNIEFDFNGILDISASKNNKFKSEKERILKERIEFMNNSIDIIMEYIFITNRDNINMKINEARNPHSKSPKSSTNIYDITLNDRMVRIDNSYIIVETKDIEEEFNENSKYKKEFFIYKDKKIYLDYCSNIFRESNNILLADLISGPKKYGNHEWFIKNNFDCLTKVIEDKFQEPIINGCLEYIYNKLFKNIENKSQDEFENLNSNTNSSEKEWKVKGSTKKIESLNFDQWKEKIEKNKSKQKLLDKYLKPYLKEKDKVLPKIYYHYNKRWTRGNKYFEEENPNKRKLLGQKFFIELDWSGEEKERHGNTVKKIYDPNVKKNYNKIYRNNK